LDQADGSFLDQADGSFLDQADGSFLDQADASFLDQADASFLDANSPAHGHGTMVAGILAAIAPDAMIMPLRAFDDEGCATNYNISKAIKYAVSHGAQVINMSFGISGGAQTLKNTIKDAEKAGVIVVASAGNDNTSVPQYPASYPGVVSVAATDLQDVKASFSNYGATISVSAPGKSIISAYPGGYYAELSGTSFAAPMVAGEAALLRSLKANASTAAIEAGVDNIDTANPKYVGQLGTGRINLLKALK
jgi:subtilisin family serine protease